MSEYQELDRRVKWVVVIAVTIAAFAIFFFQAWILMLLVGALYNSMGWFAPISYGVSCLIILLINFVGGLWKASSR